MRKLVYGMAVSLDGFMEGPKGETDWMSYDPGQENDEYIRRFDAFLRGRKTYERMVRMGAGADAFKGIKSYIFSNSLNEVKAGFQHVKSDGLKWVRQMKNEEGKDIALYGGAILGSAMVNAGLVDELVLSVQSILLGDGKPMFLNISQRIRMKLIKTRAYTAGIILHYQVKNE
jgi:dihydrofolate reductase